MKNIISRFQLGITFLAMLAALAVVAPLRADTITYDFDDGTAQGWTNVLTSPNDPPTAYEPSSRSDAAAAAQSGSFRVIPQIAGPFSPTEDSPHNTLVFRSPEFTLGPSGSISLFLNIGHGFGPGLVANFASLPASSSTFGFEGVGLRRVSDGAYVLSARRSVFGVDAWTPVDFSNASIVANGLVGTPLTLDLIDYCDGPWGWVALDTVTLYDAVAGPNNLPGWLRNPATGNYYKLTEVLPWTEAQATAQSWGGNLVTINDATENEWICQTFGTNEVFWIGFTDEVVEGSWAWVSGEPVTYQNWAAEEPNNQGNEDYAIINYWDEPYPAPSCGTWNDWPGYWQARGIVERSGPATAPLIASIPDQVAPEGVAFVGPSPVLIRGDLPITWLLIGGPAGMTIGPTNGVVSWNAPVFAGTSYGVTIRATNSTGFDDEDFLLTVRPRGSGTFHARWDQIPTTGGVPSPRYGASLVFVPNPDRLVLFGGADGYDVPGTDFGDLRVLDLGTRVWTNAAAVGAWPEARRLHSAVYDAPRNRMLVFSGYYAYGNYLNDLWALDLNTMTWTLLSPGGSVPSQRRGMASTMDTARNEWLLFGGFIHVGNFFGDLCHLDPVTSTFTGIPQGQERPHESVSPTMTYLSARDQVVLVGGLYLDWYQGDWRSHTLGDTWFLERSSNTWSQVQSNLWTPPSRAGQVAFPCGGRYVGVFGGFHADEPGVAIGAEVPLNDLWMFDPATGRWDELSPSGAAPSARGASATAVDMAEERVFVFGGTDGRGAFYEDLHLLTVTAGDSQPPVITSQPQSQTVNVGSNATFSVTASGARPFSYQWRFNGVPIGGATMTSLTLSKVQPGDAGGYFLVVSNAYGSVTSTVAYLSVNVATVDSGFNPGSSGGRHVLSLAVQTDGKILVGGDFSTLGGQARNMIGRLNSDGTLDASFNPGADNWVYALAVQEDGKILVGGFLTWLGGQARYYIGRLNPDGTLDFSFNPGADGQVLCFAVQADGKILVGGRFTTLGGQPRSRIARLNADGTLDTSFIPEADSGVLSIALQPDGKIVVGGEFTTLSGQGRDRIGRLNADGTLDTSFNSSANSTIESLAIQADEKILVGGHFSMLGGQTRNWIGRVNADGTLDPSFNPGADNLVCSFAVQADGKILVGGFFTMLGGQPRNCMGRLNADGTLDSTFNPGVSPLVYAMAEQADGKILVGGSFTTLGGEPREHIGRLNNTGPATESLTCDGSVIAWLRGGTGPEVWRTSFEHSTNGTTWTSLGVGTRIPGGWLLTGAVLPPGTVRARGHVTGGYLNGSGWFVETNLLVETIIWSPVITCPTNLLTGTDLGLCSALVAFNVSATGAPPPVVTYTLGGSVISSPFAFPVGVNAVTCTASNIAGVTTCTFTVAVEDTEPPQIACPTNIAVAFTSADGAAVSFAVTATDNCAAPVRVSCVPASGSTFPIGTTLVLCSATDTAGNSASCRFQVTVLGARGVKQQVLSELMALRAGVTGRTETDRLDAAIGSLTDALDPALWLDETHLALRHGEQVFQKERDAVNKLRHLMDDRRSTVSAAALQGLAAGLVKVDWLLAMVSVQEVSAAGLNPRKIAQALEEIARGDAAAAAGRAENAIEHYQTAWKHAAHSHVKGHVSMRGGKVRVQFTAFPDGRYAIQASTNLVDWETLRTVAANPEGVIDFEDPDSAAHRARYYRVLGP